MKGFLKVDYEPKLNDPVYVIGVSGVGAVGRVSARLLVEWAKAKPFSAYYSPHFPDQAFIQEDGTCSLPRWEFYESRSCSPNLLVAVGGSRILAEEPEAYYGVLEEILELGLKLGARRIAVLDGVAALSNQLEEVYVVATSKGLVDGLVDVGGKPLRSSRLPGDMGPLLGLARLKGLEAFGILKPSRSLVLDREAGGSAFKFLVKALGLRKRD